MPSGRPAPSDVFRSAVDLLLAKDMEGFIALFTEDGVMEFPFAPPDRPHEVVGTSALRGYLIDYPSRLDIREIKDLRLHGTTDPGVVVAELTATGFVTATGQPYELRYVAVVTFRDGRIARYRDYWNPLAVQELLAGPVAS